MKNFRRGKYLDKIYNALKTEKLILLIGARQVGKTTLLNFIQSEIEDKKVFYYSFEDEFSQIEFANKKDFLTFFEINLAIDFSKENILLLDEIQYVVGINKILKALYDDKNIKTQIIATGSGMWNLKEDNSSLVGRGEEIFVWPFSFEEFLEIKGFNVKNLQIENIPDLLLKKFFFEYEEFLRFGGYPAVVFSRTKEEKIVTLEKIIKRYLEKDIGFFLSGYELLNFKKFFSFFVSQIGNLVKKEAIADYLGIKTKEITKFLEIMEKTLFLSFVYPFFTDKQKEYSYHPKVYFLDVGVINFLKKSFDYLDFGVLNENFVFNELQKNKKFNSDEIKIYKKTSKSEIDFIYDGIDKFVPIEVKSSNSLSIPKIFYSFEKDYGEKISYFIKTTKDKTAFKMLDKKGVYFVPNYLIGKAIADL